MHHADLHAVKDPCMMPPSHNILGRCFEVRYQDSPVWLDVSGSAMVVLRQKIRWFWTPAILPENGSCPVGMLGGNPEGSWKPGAFENLLGRCIKPVNSGHTAPGPAGSLNDSTGPWAMGRYGGLPERIGRR